MKAQKKIRLLYQIEKSKIILILRFLQQKKLLSDVVKIFWKKILNFKLIINSRIYVTI